MSDDQTSFTDIASFTARCEAYCRDREISEATFGDRAAGDWKFMERLRSGKGGTVATLEKVLRFMADNPAPAGPAPVQPAEPAIDPGAVIGGAPVGAAEDFTADPAAIIAGPETAD